MLFYSLAWGDITKCLDKQIILNVAKLEKENYYVVLHDTEIQI